MEEAEIEQEQEQDREYAPRTDPILVNLLNQMEAFGYSQSVTLTVQGFLISGTPIFPAEYIEKLGKIMEESFLENARRQDDPAVAAGHARIGARLREALTEEAQRYKIPEAPEGNDEAKARREAVQDNVLAAPRDTIMLKRVTMISATGEQMDVPLWRGRLEHVAGWWLGRSERYAYSGVDPDD